MIMPPLHIVWEVARVESDPNLPKWGPIFLKLSCMYINVWRVLQKLNLYITKNEGFEVLAQTGQNCLFCCPIWNISTPTNFWIVKRRKMKSSLPQVNFKIREKFRLACLIMQLWRHNYEIFAKIFVKIWPSPKP